MCGVVSKRMSDAVVWLPRRQNSNAMKDLDRRCVSTSFWPAAMSMPVRQPQDTQPLLHFDKAGPLRRL